MNQIGACRKAGNLRSILPKRLGWPVTLANDFALDQVVLEGACHRPGPLAAFADQADAATGETFDSGNADLLCQAFGDNLALVEVHEQGAAHFLSPRRAAAI